MRIEYPDVYEAITNGVTVGRRQGYPEGSRPPGICHLTGTAQVIPHNRNLPPVKVWRAVSKAGTKVELKNWKRENIPDEFELELRDLSTMTGR